MSSRHERELGDGRIDGRGPQSPIPPRPASAENFMFVCLPVLLGYLSSRVSMPSNSTHADRSEREVVRMLGDLHRQKVDAETQAIQLQEQISSLRQQLSASVDAGGREQVSSSQDVSSDRNASANEAHRDLGSTDSELDNFIRLRSYILHMQEGASLLLWKEDGLQLCWFWLDKDCLSLNWDVDESPGELGADDGEGGGGGGSLLLERIVDIVPLGAGADQLTDAPTDSSFTVQLRDSRLDIVAPTSLDFQVWYFGLAFATRLRMNALEDASACSESHTDMDGQVETESDGLDCDAEVKEAGRASRDGEHHECPVDEGGDAAAPAEDRRRRQRRRDNGERPATGGRGHQESGDDAHVHSMKQRLQECRLTIEKLQHENQTLKDVRRSKDLAIQRLLHDIQVCGRAQRVEGRWPGIRLEPMSLTSACTCVSRLLWHTSARGVCPYLAGRNNAHTAPYAGLGERQSVHCAAGWQAGTWRADACSRSLGCLEADGRDEAGGA